MMNRREAIGAMGVGLGALGLNFQAGAFQVGAFKKDILRVGDIVECTVTWTMEPIIVKNGTHEYVQPVCDYPRDFMGVTFKNGDVKRFKLLEKYDEYMDLPIAVYGYPNTEFGHGHDEFGYPLLNENLLERQWGDPGYDLYTAHNDLTLHAIVHGETFGTYTTKWGETVKWAKLYEPCDDYIATKKVLHKNMFTCT